MKSAERGNSTSGVELANVSAHGIWLLIDGSERYLAFDDFPWFRDATIRQLGAIERPHPEHLHWPDLDVDLSIDSIVRPHAYPLVSNARTVGPT
jgi:hypothetical protein